MEPTSAESDIPAKEPPLFHHSIPALQVSQGIMYGINIHDESEGPSTELKLGHGSYVTTKRILSESQTVRQIKRLRQEDGEGPNGMSLELKLAFEPPWTMKKELTASDISHKQGRLLLAQDSVRNHILAHWDGGRVNNAVDGVQVSVWDCDTKSEHQLLFTQRPSNGSYALITNWNVGFVRRRGLKIGDKIGLYWDQSNSRFSFSLLKQALSN